MNPMPPPLPELPPMQSATQPMPHMRDEPRQSVGRVAVGQARRLRQIMGAVAGGGMLLMVGVLGAEKVLPPGWRPSDQLATIEARVELGVMNQKMKAMPGSILLTEADYQQALAKAQRDGQAKAELDYQKKLAVVQSDKERVFAAYQTLFQRTNIIAQAALQLEQLAMQLRSQLLQMTNGGRGVVISFKDIFCGLGSYEACASAKEDRRMMIAEADELSRGDVGAKVRELMATIPDPASLIVNADISRNGAPVIER